MDCGSLSRSVQPEIARNEDVEARDTKGINLISMKPFLLTIVGPFQPPNPPYFQSLVCNKAFSFFFFSKLIVFSDDFIAVTLHRTFTKKIIIINLHHAPPFLVLKKKKYRLLAEISLLSRWEIFFRKG